MVENIDLSGFKDLVINFFNLGIFKTFAQRIFISNSRNACPSLSIFKIKWNRRKLC